MKTAYIDCFSGVSGDMLLGALVDCGWPVSELEDNLGRLDLQGYRVSAEKTVKQGLAATALHFDLPKQPPQRRFGELLQIVERSRLTDEVKISATSVLRRLAEAEAKVHGVTGTIEDIHFHELGSWDTLLDIVGVVAGLRALGMTRVVVSPIQLGGGFVRTAHGQLPVPAPAVAELLRGVPVVGGETRDGELTTPTGAALVSSVATAFGSMPAIRPAAIGYGAGNKEGRVPNVLRVFIGESIDNESDQIAVLETNVDDLTPELQAAAIEKLLAGGALDAFLIPVIMKKGRPGAIISVICALDRADALEGVLFEETTTLGVRRMVMSRHKLERRHVVVDTEFGSVRVKLGLRGHRVSVASPEFEDCKQLALSHGVAVRAVYEAAQLAFATGRTPHGPEFASGGLPCSSA